MKMKVFILSTVICLFIFISSCSYFTPPSKMMESEDSKKSDNGFWAWVGGSNLCNQPGVFAGKSSDIPGARDNSMNCKDNSGNLWLFGGYGFDYQGTFGYLRDLWKFDGVKWTFIAGNSLADSTGTNVSNNVPAGRRNGACWIDNSGNFWIFGGFGWDINGSLGALNDLWKYDGNKWTLVKGSNVSGQTGSYGTIKTASAGNTPGARNGCVGWKDLSGNFWLFGGIDGWDIGNYFNDLWKFDGTNWTWMSGSPSPNQWGNYGILKIAGSSNVPGARYMSTGCMDSLGNFWLFGGMGLDVNASNFCLNDLWRFDGTNWTWMSGSSVANQKGIYGSKGVTASGNFPGSRKLSISWIDDRGNFWIFGGEGYDKNGGAVTKYLSDLWKFDGTNWTWVTGSNLNSQLGNYGLLGIASTSNDPGIRAAGISWVDNSGNLFLFSGVGSDVNSNPGCMNDVWRYKP